MYGNGGAEEAERSRRGQRDSLFVVGKVYPHRSPRRAYLRERSLKRLRTDRIDLYLLHERQPTAATAGLQAPRMPRTSRWAWSNFSGVSMQG